MQVDIDDKGLRGFNDPAKDEVRKATLSFAEDLMKEANRIESARNTGSNAPQVTSSMVEDAAVLLRRGLARPKRGFWTRAIRVVAAVLSLVVGFLYDSTKLQDSTYMLLFIVLVAVSIVAVTVAAIQE